MICLFFFFLNTPLCSHSSTHRLCRTCAKVGFFICKFSESNFDCGEHVLILWNLKMKQLSTTQWPGAKFCRKFQSWHTIGQIHISSRRCRLSTQPCIWTVRNGTWKSTKTFLSRKFKGYRNADPIITLKMFWIRDFKTFIVANFQFRKYIRIQKY